MTQEQAKSKHDKYDSRTQEMIDNWDRALWIGQVHNKIHREGEGCCCLTGAPCPFCPTHRVRKET